MIYDDVTYTDAALKNKLSIIFKDLAAAQYAGQGTGIHQGEPDGLPPDTYARGLAEP